MHYKSYHALIFVAVMVSSFLLPFSYSFAETSHVRFNNENWGTLPHPRVAEFTVHPDGSASGITENGIPFVQFNVQNEYGIKVQRFEIEDHYHYVVGGVIANSLEEMSVLLIEAHTLQSQVGLS